MSKSTYYDYLKNYQKLAWWEYPIDWLSRLIQEHEDKFGQDGYDPNNITEEEDDIYEMARHDINISVDKKTRVITIRATSQDPVICKTLGDSIKDKLQVFITQYRTNKARIDCEYYQKLTDSARIDFETNTLICLMQAPMSPLKVQHKDYRTLPTTHRKNIILTQNSTPSCRQPRPRYRNVLQLSPS